MDILISKLPRDIVEYIIPYTYQLQPKTILNEIINYKETKKIISELYYNFWIIYMEEDELEDKYWLINDIVAYINNYKATMYGYVDNFYNIFRRNPRLQTREDINKYFGILETKPVTSQINIIWALLTPRERNDIISVFQEEKSGFTFLES
jgi:hypothetical protein